MEFMSTKLFKIYFLFIFLWLSLSWQEASSSSSITILDENASSNATCAPCPEGTFTNDEEKISNCTDLCPSGFCPKNETYRCVPCKAGTYNDLLNASYCQDCLAGQVATTSGSHNCTPCDAGSYSNVANTRCIPCPAGTKSSESGSSQCTDCTAGEYSNEGSTECSNCAPGTYNQFPASGSCTPCGQGKWNPEKGSTRSSACLECPDGYYCPQQENAQPTTCPSNHYCRNSAISPQQCSSLFESDSGSVNCKPKVALYVLVAIGCAVVVTFLFGLVWYKTKNSKSMLTYEEQHVSEKKDKRTTETDRLVPPAKGPVYEGL